MSVIVEHSGVSIEYDERTNLWRFEHNGRERKVQSLAAAKASIDKPEPKEKKKFTPIAAWMGDRWGGTFEAVTITSVADDPRYAWINRNGKRSKEQVNQLFAATDENDSLRARIGESRKQVKAIEKHIAELYESLTPVDLSAAVSA